jgi:hypothetical protein
MFGFFFTFNHEIEIGAESGGKDESNEICY